MYLQLLKAVFFDPKIHAAIVAAESANVSFQVILAKIKEAYADWYGGDYAKLVADIEKDIMELIAGQ